MEMNIINAEDGIGMNVQTGGGSGGTKDHSKLQNLDYEHSGHTGFAANYIVELTKENDEITSNKTINKIIEAYKKDYIVKGVLTDTEAGVDFNLQLLIAFEDSDFGLVQFATVYDSGDDFKSITIIGTLENNEDSWQYLDRKMAYTAGTGIEITNGNVINNTLPNKIVSITVDEQTMELDKTAGEINSLIEQGYLILLMGRLMFIEEYDSSRNKLYAYFYSGGFATKFTITGNQVTDYESLDVVYDNHYNHTDNNYTNAEKNKLAGLENKIINVNADQQTMQFDKTADEINEYLNNGYIVMALGYQVFRKDYNASTHTIKLAIFFGSFGQVITVVGNQITNVEEYFYVSDNSYVHTDNNFSSEYKSKLDTYAEIAQDNTGLVTGGQVYEAFVKPTDYASPSKGGVVKIDGFYGVDNADNGKLRGSNLTYNDYLNINNRALISKIALENVITGKELVNKSQLEKAEMVYNAIPKVTGTGTDLTLDDTAEAPMKLEVESNTYQLSTTGKNLADFPTNATLPLNDNITTVLDLGEDKTFDNLTLTFFMNNAKFTSASSSAVVDYLKDDGTHQYRTSGSFSMNINTNLNGVYSHSESNITFRYLNVYLGSGYSGFTQGKCSIQLEESATATSYEPYSGGIAVPAPSSPQTIQVVTGNNSIKIQNKNLLNMSDMEIGGLATGYVTLDKFRITNGYHPIKVLPNTKYTFSVVLSDEVKGVRVGVHSCDANMNFLSDSSWKQLASTPYTITTSSDTHYLKFVFSLSTTSNNVTTGGTENTTAYTNVNEWLRGIKLQVEKSSTATDYVEYKEQVFPLTLGNIEYCKIGDYKDRIFKNVVGDVDYDSSKELGKWYIKKNIGKVVLDGDENWTENESQALTNTIYLYSDVLGTTKVEKNNLSCFSNYFKDELLWSVDVEGINIVTGVNGLRIRLNKITAANAAAFKTWLSTHNTNIYYPLATPTYTLLDSTLQTQLDNISNAIGYQGQINISQTNADLPAIINASAVMDLNSLVTRVAVLEAE